MAIFTTTYRKIDEFGQIRVFAGENIDQPDWESAEKYCEIFNPDLSVDGKLIEEIYINEMDIDNIKKSNFLM